MAETRTPQPDHIVETADGFWIVDENNRSHGWEWGPYETRELARLGMLQNFPTTAQELASVGRCEHGAPPRGRRGELSALRERRGVMTGTAYGARSARSAGFGRLRSEYQGNPFEGGMPEILIRKPGGQYVTIVSEEPYASEVAEMIAEASTADELPSVEFESYQVVSRGRENWS